MLSLTTTSTSTVQQHRHRLSGVNTNIRLVISNAGREVREVDGKLVAVDAKSQPLYADEAATKARNSLN
jgi:hypothetical protein